MNIWTKRSIELANQRDYLDQLFKVYPMSNNLSRELPENVVAEIRNSFDSKENEPLIRLLLQQELFPVKDSYVAYLKRDNTSISRNPQTVNRLAGAIYSMGFEDTIKQMTLPKETNRQIGPLFKNWIKSRALGVNITSDVKYFLSTTDNIVFDASDAAMEVFARSYLGYTHEKGLDFIAKFNSKFVIGEAKFLTDFGGHQNAQLADAINTMRSSLNKTDFEVIKIAILDGVIYIPGNHKMKNTLSSSLEDEVIVSALLLRDYLYTL
ncbi:MAG: restriction endonuclease [Bacillota bacterium]|nr:restriction endonuclease [Bacillota bacterium]